MAEPQQRTSSVDLKEKKALLDEDIGNDDFLSSWKSMSEKEDDSLDFNFDSIPKTNNTKFKFDNMDMDFNLDGDFDKLTSFKVDMADIDFSFSPKKKSNPKDKTEEKSCRNQGKKENFAFSFDFKELDSFSFASSLEREEKAPENRTDRNVDASGDTVNRGLKSKKAKENGTGEDGVTAKPQPSQSMVTTKVDSLSDNQENFDFISKGSPSDSASSDNKFLSCGAKTSQKKEAISTEVINPGRRIFETSISKEVVDKQPMANITMESVDNDASSRGTTIESEHHYQKINAVTKGDGDEGTNNKVVTCLESSNGKSSVKGSVALPAVLPERNKSESGEFSSHSLSKSISSNEHSQGDLDLCDTSTSNSIKMQQDMTTKKENQSSTKIMSRAPKFSQVIVDKVTLMKAKKEGTTQSMFFKRSEEAKTRLHPESGAGIRVISAANGTTATLNSIPIDRKREVVNADNTQLQSKVVVESTMIRDVTEHEPVMLAKRNIGSLKNDWNPLAGNGAQDGSKHSHNNGQNGREVTAKIMVNNIKDCSSSGSLLNTSSSAEKAKTSITQSGSNILNSSLAPIQRSKIISSGKNHLCPPRPGKKLTDLSNIVIPRNLEPKKDPLEHIPVDKNHLDRNLENEGSRESKVVSSVGSTAKQTTFSPSLKRKSSEAPTADIMLLNPPKRLSQSPTQSRIIKDIAHSVSSEQNKEKSAFRGHETARVEFPPELQMTDIGSPSVMDNDNVEKAEAYTKELEDICNMLRKKHEEAKELLVRAIVNNNNLLMLNHPMYEEKIHMVQKFAALMSKELPV